LYSELRKKYSRLVERYNVLLGFALKNRNAFRRLLSSYYLLKKNYLILRRYSTRKVTALIDHINNEKYQMVFDEYRKLYKISDEFLSEIEMERDEFIKSVYIDILFEKYLPQPDRNQLETLIAPFQFPVMLKNYESGGESIHPFVHFGISGKVSREKKDRQFLYYLNLENISSSIELDYFQKTDTLINKLSRSNLNLLNAKKTIEMHKRMLISLTCSLIGEYSRETSVHLKNMEILATYLTLECKQMGLIQTVDYDLDEYIKDINYTSVLHDIGKMAIPREILEKDDALTGEEITSVRQHPAIGASYIKKIMEMFDADPLYSSYCSFLQIPWEICRYHHERWDGTGYPEGLSGENIPVAARIITVVDTYEALRGERTYNHSRKSHDDALEIIRNESGLQFDPRIVTAFVNISYKCAHVHEDCQS
jgi:HD-GYP domain-containing protein (c-di-GMP phosphodiesterase class II)